MPHRLNLLMRCLRPGSECSESAVLFPHRKMIQFPDFSGNLFIPIVVCACGIIFSKGKAIHRFIKVCVMVSSAMVIEVLSKTSGYFFGLAVSSDNFVIQITRASPYILGPIMALVLHEVDIARYEHLSAEMVTIISTLTAVLLGVGLFEHIEYIEDMTTNVDRKSVV